MIWSKADAERDARSREEAFRRLVNGRAILVCANDDLEEFRAHFSAAELSKVEIHGTGYLPAGSAYVIDKPKPLYEWLMDDLVAGRW